MLGRILKTVANEFLRNRRAQTGRGPGRLPPTSVNEAGYRATHGVVRWVMGKLLRR